MLPACLTPVGLLKAPQLVYKSCSAGTEEESDQLFLVKTTLKGRRVSGRASISSKVHHLCIKTGEMLVVVSDWALTYSSLATNLWHNGVLTPALSVTPKSPWEHDQAGI